MQETGRLITGKDVMPRVNKWLSGSGQTMGAVAYVTRDHLQLKDGDVLFVNASHDAVSQGGTNPDLLLDLLGRGVVVINDPTLHAKVIVKGRRAAIGSANLSARTLTLNEAVWVTQDGAVLESAERWLNEMLDERAEMTESELQGLRGLFPNGGDGHEPAGPEVTVDPFDPDRVESIIFWAADDDASDDLPGGGEASEIEPGLDGYRWIQNEDWEDARKGQVWMRYERKLESPRRVIQPRSTQEARDGSRWTRVGFRRADRGMRSMPAWLRDEYGDEIRARESFEVKNPDRVRELLSLWSDAPG